MAGQQPQQPDQFDTQLRRLQARVAEVEAALHQVGAGAGGDRQGGDELRQLRRTVADLATDCRELHLELDRLTSAVEERAAEVTAAEVDELLDPFPELDRPGPPLIRLARRVRKQVKRLARRLREATDPYQPPEVDLRLRLLDERVGELPRVSIVAVGSGPGLRESARVRLGSQTSDAWELVLWDESTGGYVVEDSAGNELFHGTVASAEQLSRVVSGDLVLELPATVTPSPTLVECLGFVVASERLRVVLLPGEETSPGLLAVARPLWKPLRGADVRALAAAARRELVGKVVSARRPGTLFDPLGPGSHKLVCQRGEYLLPVRLRDGVVAHRLRPLSATPAPGPTGEPAILVLLDAPLRNGLEQRLTGLLRSLGEELRFAVVAVGAADALTERRLDALSRLVPHVYPAGALLAEPLLPSLVERLLAAHAVATVLHLGDGGEWLRRLALLRRQFPGLRVVDQPIGAGEIARARPADLHLAATAGIRQALLRQGVQAQSVVELPVTAAWPAGCAAPAAGRTEALRAELGVPEGAKLVTMVADLVGESRPEDFVALALRIADDESVHFLLAGDGPLAAAVADLARVLAVPRFQLRPPTVPIGELVAASDLLCSTAVSEGSPSTLLVAAALGRPLVTAAPLDGVAEAVGVVLAAASLGRVGDIAGMERAIRELTQRPRPAALEEWPQRLEESRRRAAGVYRSALVG